MQYPEIRIIGEIFVDKIPVVSPSDISMYPKMIKPMPTPKSM